MLHGSIIKGRIIMKDFNLADMLVTEIKAKGRADRLAIAKRAVITISLIYSVYNIVDTVLEIDYKVKDRKRKTQQDLQTISTVCNFLKSL